MFNVNFFFRKLISSDDITAEQFRNLQLCFAAMQSTRKLRVKSELVAVDSTPIYYEKSAAQVRQCWLQFLSGCWELFVPSSENPRDVPIVPNTRHASFRVSSTLKLNLYSSAIERFGHIICDVLFHGKSSLPHPTETDLLNPKNICYFPYGAGTSRSFSLIEIIISKF